MEVGQEGIMRVHDNLCSSLGYVVFLLLLVGESFVFLLLFFLSLMTILPPSFGYISFYYRTGMRTMTH